MSASREIKETARVRVDGREKSARVSTNWTNDAGLIYREKKCKKSPVQVSAADHS